MNQAQQQRVLQQFSDGIYNILVCTCVGEEGLDVSILFSSSLSDQSTYFC
jgi:ERCC4-related helicase